MQTGEEDGEDRELAGIRLRVRRQSSWSDQSEELTACFEISIGNPNCTGTSLEAQLRWAAGRFHQFEFSIGDTLNRHNYAAIGHETWGKVSLGRAEEICVDEGDTWLDANKERIAAALPADSYRFVRWNEWRSHESFAEAITEATELVTASPTVAKAVRDDIDNFLRRKGVDSPSNEQIEMLIQHPIEEAAVYLIQARCRPTLLLYPGSMMLVWQHLFGEESPSMELRTLHFRYVEVKA